MVTDIATFNSGLLLEKVNKVKQALLTITSPYKV
jgi:hypothetical protein